MTSSYLLQLVFGLLIVVLCIFALAWFSKKMNRFNSSTDDALKIIGAISMGSRERIVHLQIGEEQLLIGVSPGRINTLHVLNEPVETITKSNSISDGNGFSDRLKTMVLDVNKPNDKKTK
jgi:flagellar protein FliO/FliZ